MPDELHYIYDSKRTKQDGDARLRLTCGELIQLLSGYPEDAQVTVPDVQSGFKFLVVGDIRLSSMLVGPQTVELG